MKNRFSITTDKPHRVLALALGLILLAAGAFAHGGFDHIRGTVVKVADNVLTVKTATGNVDFKLDSRTSLTRNDAKAQVADLKQGTRIVVEVPEGSKDRVARLIRIGTAPKAPAPVSHHHSAK